MFDEPDNLDRAEWAHKACDTFAAATNMRDEELCTVMQDLLTDLMHLARFKNLDFEQILTWARGNFQEDVEEEEDE